MNFSYSYTKMPKNHLTPSPKYKMGGPTWLPVIYGHSARLFRQRLARTRRVVSPRLHPICIDILRLLFLSVNVRSGSLIFLVGLIKKGYEIGLTALWNFVFLFFYSAGC